MLNYRDYEKQVFDWLMSKYKSDGFTFSLRQVANKGAEKDYFIGTEKSRYFATTFWYISVAFPGSSSDLITLQFTYSRDKHELIYFFEFNQTKNPHDRQNESALNLIKALKDPLEARFGLRRKFSERSKMFNFQLKPVEKSYGNINMMFNDIDSQLTEIIGTVNKYIELEKKENSDFVAHRITSDEFEKNLDKYKTRVARFPENIETETLGNARDNLYQDSTTVDLKFPLNQILYGPPGTGKTYTTINRALSIIENTTESDLENENRADLKSRYERYVENGQIVFTTFHQSLSYEDFIEGIKPEIEEDKEGVRKVVYEVKDGIFKEICNKADLVLPSETNDSEFHFDDGWNDLIAEMERHNIDGKDFVLDVLTKNKGFKVTEVTNNGNIRLKPQGREGSEYTVSYKRMKALQKAIPDVSKVKNIDKEFRAVIGGMNSTAYWAVLNFINNWLNNNNDKVNTNENDKGKVPHVLIIDEINRGNLSAIFGELITLVEESKRSGQDEALEITLPYSKQKFSVPSNLYIIGTMNTADRSVEALDTALRRRFSFIEMMPKPELLAEIEIEGINLKDVLGIINKRITTLLDSDHQIGHSYMINVRDLNEVKIAFNDCIIPLLKEYFYHDEEKIALVLGEGFVQLEDTSDQLHDIFPKLSFPNLRLPNGKPNYIIKNLEEAEIVNALKLLITTNA